MFPEHIECFLPMLFLHDFHRHLSEKIIKVFIGQPRHFVIFPHRKQSLKAEFRHFVEFLSDMCGRYVGIPPKRKVAGVQIERTGNRHIAAVRCRHLEKLPADPRIAIPNQFEERIGIDHPHPFLVMDNFTDFPRHGKECQTFLHQLARKRIEHNQPAQIAGRRNFEERPAHGDKALTFRRHGHHLLSSVVMIIIAQLFAWCEADGTQMVRRGTVYLCGGDCPGMCPLLLKSNLHPCCRQHQQHVRLAAVAYPLRRGITHYTLQARSCAKGGLRPPLESPGEVQPSQSAAPPFFRQKSPISPTPHCGNDRYML